MNRDAKRDDICLQKECGVTGVSTANSVALLQHIGLPVSITLSFDDVKWYQVVAVFASGYTHTFNGFSWGYDGEGCRGLLDFLKRSQCLLKDDNDVNELNQENPKPNVWIPVHRYPLSPYLLG